MIISKNYDKNGKTYDRLLKGDGLTSRPTANEKQRPSNGEDIMHVALCLMPVVNLF